MIYFNGTRKDIDCMLGCRKCLTLERPRHLYRQTCFISVRAILKFLCVCEFLYVCKALSANCYEKTITHISYYIKYILPYHKNTWFSGDTSLLKLD